MFFQYIVEVINMSPYFQKKYCFHWTNSYKIYFSETT